MSGNLTINLIEILAYLFPGAIVLAGILYVHFPDLGDRTLNGPAYQIAFAACSYVTGHLLMLISYLLTLLKEPLKKVARIKSPEKRLYFYQDLRRKLQEIFGENISRGHIYQFSNRLITDNASPASQVVERLYALMLFSRNITISFIATGIIFSSKSTIAAGVLGALATLFLMRYILMEKVMTDTVFRAAYVYLCSKDKQEESKISAPKNA
jgi:ABC-type multidrug transport system fused ATPase/permease subunit